MPIMKTAQKSGDVTRCIIKTYGKFLGFAEARIACPFVSSFCFLSFCFFECYGSGKDFENRRGRKLFFTSQAILSGTVCVEINGCRRNGYRIHGLRLPRRR